MITGARLDVASIKPLRLYFSCTMAHIRRKFHILQVLVKSFQHVSPVLLNATRIFTWNSSADERWSWTKDFTLGAAWGWVLVKKTCNMFVFPRIKHFMFSNNCCGPVGRQAAYEKQPSAALPKLEVTHPKEFETRALLAPGRGCGWPGLTDR